MSSSSTGTSGRSAFRRFEFFEVDTLANDVTADLGTTPTCTVAEGGMILFGDAEGNLIWSDRNFHVSGRKYRVFRGEIKSLFYLYDPVIHSRQYIVAVGNDTTATSSNSVPIFLIKVFLSTDLVRPIQAVNATMSDGSIPTAAAALGDGSQIAVGYSSGCIVLYSANFFKAAGSSQQRSNISAGLSGGAMSGGGVPTPTVLLSSHKYPVSALHFCDIPSVRSVDRRVRLFAAMDDSNDAKSSSSQQQTAMMNNETDDPSSAGILVFDTSMTINAVSGAAVAAPRHPPKVLDERGAPLHGVSFMKSTSELIVARGEAVYTYSIEDRGGALAMSGDKVCACAVGRYTLIVSVDEKGTERSSSIGVDPIGSTMLGTTKPKRPLVNIYDLKNKVICGTSKKFYLPHNEQVLYAMNDGSAVYLITSSWTMIRFQEKDTQRKLDVLLGQCKPPLYSMAITIAAEEQLEAEEVSKLFKLYADHLYDEGDYKAAVEQYCHTVGFTPPSYVIIKFLDPYRIPNLIVYLEHLHIKGLAAADHITLLINCYTKTKDEGKISSLLEGIFGTIPPSKNEMSSEKTRSKGSLFNPDQAITALKTAGYTAHALKVAARYYRHNSYIEIQMNKNPPLYDDVLGYLAYLPFVLPLDDYLPLLKLHGTTLLNSRPTTFTALLIKLCSGQYVSLLPPSHPGALSAAAPGGNNTAGTSSSSTGSGSVNEIGQTHSSTLSHTDISKAFAHLIPEDVVVPTTPVPPSKVMSILVEDEKHLLMLLEGVYNASAGHVLPPKVATTLIELYLGQYSRLRDHFRSLSGEEVHTSNNTSASYIQLPADAASTEKAIQVLENKAMAVLDGVHAKYDPAHALLLCHAAEFERGQRFLLEKQQSVELLMRMLIEKKDNREVFKLLRREGSKDPELYVQVLTYFVEQSVHSDREDDQVIKAMRRSSVSGRDSDDEIDNGEEEFSSEDEESLEDSRWNSIIDVMDLIEREAILSPLQVLTILSKNPNLPLHVAAPFIGGVLRGMSESITQVESDVRGSLNNLQVLATSKNAESQLSASMRRQQERALLRQQRRENGENYEDDDDDDEEEELEQMRLNEEKQRDYWKNIKKSMLECSSNHEAFYNTLEHSSDGFSTVVEHFGRSIIKT